MKAKEKSKLFAAVWEGTKTRKKLRNSQLYTNVRIEAGESIPRAEIPLVSLWRRPQRSKYFPKVHGRTDDSWHDSPQRTPHWSRWVITEEIMFSYADRNNGPWRTHAGAGLPWSISTRQDDPGYSRKKVWEGRIGADKLLWLDWNLQFHPLSPSRWEEVEKLGVKLRLG